MKGKHGCNEWSIAKWIAVHVLAAASAVKVSQEKN